MLKFILQGTRRQGESLLNAAGFTAQFVRSRCSFWGGILNMLEKIEDGLFEALEEIVFLHEHDDVSQQTKPILLDLFRFIEDNQEMCRVLLSPHGDMNFLHRLNEVVREKCLQMWPNKEDKNDATFEYHYSFVVYGCVGVFRAWLNSECQEPAEKMAEMADAMIRRGSLSIA